MISNVVLPDSAAEISRTSGSTLSCSFLTGTTTESLPW
jgi:hypothetical protein